MNSNDLDYLKCPTCGMGLKEIKEKRVIGCADCLFFFRNFIVEMLLNKNDEITYRGKYQKTEDCRETSNFQAVEKLQMLLEKSVEKEDYEMAIYFRERIKKQKEL